MAVNLFLHTLIAIAKSFTVHLKAAKFNRKVHNTVQGRSVWHIKAEKKSQSVEHEPPAQPQTGSAAPQRTRWLTGRFFLDRNPLRGFPFCSFYVQTTVVLWSQSWSETAGLRVTKRQEPDFSHDSQLKRGIDNGPMMRALTVFSCPPSSWPLWPSAQSRSYKHLQNVEMCNLLSKWSGLPRFLCRCIDKKAAGQMNHQSL